MTFKEWMKEVDAEVTRKSGLGVYDLADYLYRDAYDDGADPKEVAHEVLAENDFPF